MTWVRPDEAAAMLATAGPDRLGPAAIRVIAHREHWRRLRIGRTVVYHLDDVTDTTTRRRQQRRDQQT